MGNSEEGKPSKAEKYSAALDQNNIHVYPDWATMQAYYGPRLAMPPYMNSAVSSPHAPPHYMWGPPQSMIPPYGTPYAAFYAHGGVYAHPGVPLGGTALSMETPAKSPGNADGGHVKKLKEFDGLTISVDNGNCDCTERETEHRISDSDENEGSSDGNNGVAAEAGQNGKKRSRQGSPNSAGNSKTQKKSSSIPAVEVGQASKNIDVQTKTAETMDTELKLKYSSGLNVKPSPTSVPQPSLSNETWVQGERELKREKRKQSNRESARRSRLRKQAETEELANKVQALISENMTLQSEINKMMESSEKLKNENSILTEKLRDVQPGKIDLHKIDDLRLKPVGTVNLLERVNNSDTAATGNEDAAPYDNRSPGAKLHQLLDTNPRTDPLAAS